jgi:hypothetical protein
VTPVPSFSIAEPALKRSESPVEGSPARIGAHRPSTQMAAARQRPAGGLAPVLVGAVEGPVLVDQVRDQVRWVEVEVLPVRPDAGPCGPERCEQTLAQPPHHAAGLWMVGVNDRTSRIAELSVHQVLGRLPAQQLARRLF